MLPMVEVARWRVTDVVLVSVVCTRIFNEIFPSLLPEMNAAKRSHNQNEIVVCQSTTAAINNYQMRHYCTGPDDIGLAMI